MCDRPTERWTDGRTDTPSYRDATAHLKRERENERERGVGRSTPYQGTWWSALHSGIACAVSNNCGSCHLVFPDQLVRDPEEVISAFKIKYRDK